MIKELSRRRDIQRQKLKDLNKELENVKNNQTEMLVGLTFGNPTGIGEICIKSHMLHDPRQKQ